MHRIYCHQSRFHQSAEHRFCPRCGGSLPQLEDDGPPKRSRWFAGTRISEGDPEGAFLRVTSYRKEQVLSAPECSVTVPGNHVRFSIWVDEAARCVLSIPEGEARDLAAFLTDELDPAGSERIDWSENRA